MATPPTVRKTALTTQQGVARLLPAASRRDGAGSRAERTFSLGLGLICLGGLALRVSVVLDQQPPDYPLERLALIGGDGVDYALISRSLASGDGFVGFPPGSRPQSGRPPS